MRSDEVDIDDPATDRLLEIMLTEATGGAAPRDLSEQIMAKLDAEKAYDHAPQIHIANTGASGNRSWMPAAIAAVVLICLGGVGWKVYQDAGQTGSHIAQQPEQNPTENPSVETPNNEDVQPTPKANPQGTELVETDSDLNIGKLPFGVRINNDSENRNPINAGSRDVIAQLPPKQIIDRVDASLESAWQRLSIAPAEQADQLVVARRIAFAMTGDVASIPESLNQQDLLEFVRSEPVANFVSEKWAEYLFGRPAWNRLSEPQRDEVALLFAECFQGKRAFNDVVFEMLATEPVKDRPFDPVSAWVDVLGNGNAVALTDQMCSVLLDMDVSCGRCHDHPLERNIAQRDYWNLNAVFAHTPSEDSKPKTIFYEGSDGLQKVATPQIAQDWISGVQGDAEVSRVAIGKQIQHSNELAEATINGMWKLLFGSRLVGRTSDPLAPPIEQGYSEARQLLATQLQAHNYDLGLALSWLAASKPMSLGNAKSLDEQNVLADADLQMAESEMQKRAFAAYTTANASFSFRELVDAATDFNRGGSLQNNVLLAQPAESTSKPKAPSKAELRRQALMRSFPAGRGGKDLPAGWLNALQKSGGFQEQAKHLFYVAGYSSTIPGNHMEAAKKIRSSSSSDEEALNQLWWVIRLSNSVL